MSEKPQYAIYTVGYRIGEGRKSRARTHEEMAALFSDAGLRSVDLADVRARVSGPRIARGWDFATLRLRPFRDAPSPLSVYYQCYTSLGNAGRTQHWQRGRDAMSGLLSLALDIARQSHEAGWGVVLLCAEQDPSRCHRSEVAESIAGIIRAAGVECEVRHLGGPEVHDAK